MKKIELVLATTICFFFSLPANAALIYDIHSVVTDEDLGHIEFSHGGVLTNPTDVDDFDYTSRYRGIHFTEDDIYMLNVLVDEANGLLCWGDWALGLTTIDPNNPCGRQTDPFTFAPDGMQSLDPDGHYQTFWGGGKIVLPNRASDGGDDDEDLYFVPRAVPEPSTSLLLLMGLVATVVMRGHRSKRQSFHANQ